MFAARRTRIRAAGARAAEGARQETGRENSGTTRHRVRAGGSVKCVLSTRTRHRRRRMSTRPLRSTLRWRRLMTHQHQECRLDQNYPRWGGVQSSTLALKAPCFQPLKRESAYVTFKLNLTFERAPPLHRGEGGHPGAVQRRRDGEGGSASRHIELDPVSMKALVFQLLESAA